MTARAGARPAARSAIWSMRWRPPRPAPRLWCFATSVSITPASRRGWMNSPGHSSPSASGAETGSRCWSPTERNGLSPPSRAAKIGAVVAAVSTFSTPRELAWALEHSGAAALITLEAFRGRRFLDALRDLCPELDGSAPGALRSARLPILAHRRGCGGARTRRGLLAAAIPGTGRNSRCRGTRRRTAGCDAAGHLLHPLYLGLDRGAKGRDLGAWAADRQRLRHRRTAAPSRQRPVMARRAAVLVIRLGQCRAGDHDAWRLPRAAGELRGGRSSGADRARALQRLLRHGQHGAGPAGARGPPWAPARCDADRLNHRPARRHRDDHRGAGSRRTLQCLRLDGDLWQLRRDRCQ